MEGECEGVGLGGIVCEGMYVYWVQDAGASMDWID